ncbi:preprotein translocase subunit SecG [Hyphomicrobium sp.]|jgi:preprotein translocase subunit SecG|uniref:preprotein translocase subunit SecG n=1 Tax=Hyphomicrobium sp. TaxID=82 RepID=UPI002C63B1CF|nr:preprotein translocase subunit SecG [Hyphomicrobium sp.]HVZ03725.1 preprotein translocase subunit SecG [Hyphomicrobium sp.]
MATVLLVIHLMISAALVGVVLLQKSEGGALGIGGGGGGGGFLTGRGTANLLTRTTAALAAAFFLTSILLTLLARHTAPVGSMFDQGSSGAAPTTGPAVPGENTSKAPAGRGGILDKLQQRGNAPAVPQNQ